MDYATRRRVAQALITAAEALKAAADVPAWAKAAGFQEKMGVFKLFIAKDDRLLFLTPNKGGFRLRYNSQTKDLEAPPTDAKDGPGFKTKGPVPFDQMMGMHNKGLYNLTVEVTKTSMGSWDVRFRLRPSNAVGKTIGLVTHSVSKASDAVALVARMDSEERAQRFLASFIGKPARFINK